MSGLICNECLQVPYVEFLPGLMVGLFCHEKNLVSYMDLDKTIGNLFTLKCSRKNCQKQSHEFHVLFSNIICDKCLNDKKNINQIGNNYIKHDLLLTKCIYHFTRYSYYDEERHCFFCEYCDIPNTSKKLNEYDKELPKETTDKIDKFVESKKEINYPKYYELLIKRIIETYENYGKNLKFNAYYNALNASNFLSNYSILSPFCQKCRSIFHIHIENINNKVREIKDNKFQKEGNVNLDFSCKCSKLNQCSIKDFENLINLNVCDNCNNIFAQTDLIYDNIFEKFFCYNCTQQKQSLDYIRFNEFIYICWIHKKSFDCYCNKCGKLFCSECKNLDNHEIKKLNYEKTIYPSFFNSIDWFIKLKNQGLLNLDYKKEKCKRVSEIIKIELEKLIKSTEKDKKKSFEDRNKLEHNSSLLTQNLSLIELYISNSNLSTKILNLQNKNNELILSSETILKELNQKNALVNLVSIRNIFQHLIINIIKKNYSKFEKIKEDFRILYESYKYLNYEFIKENNKNSKSIIEKKLTDLISKFIELIKNSIKRRVIERFIARLKKINEDKNLNLDNKLIKKMNKNDNIQDYFDKIINKNLPKIYYNEKLKIFNNVFENEIKNKIDKEKFSVNKSKFNDVKSLIDSKEFLKNSQKNENYQHLLLKEKDQIDFLNSVKCKNEMEFYFLYLLIQNIIKRIGNIVHQNDKEFKLVFKDISKDLNKRNYKLFQDKNEKNGFKFSEEKSENDIKPISLTNQIIKLNDINNFSSNFFSIHLPKLKALIGEQKIKKLKNKISKELDFFNIKNQLLNIVKNISDFQKEATIFYNNYKELLVYFPPIKQYLADKIDDDDFELPIKNINIEYSNDIKNAEITHLVKYFVENYLLILYARKSIKYSLEEYNNQCNKYEELLENNLNFELSNIILESYKNKMREDNMVDIFKQERDKLIDTLTKMKKNLPKKIENNNSENQEDNKILLEQEINKYNLLIEEMKDIKIEFLDEKFEEYLQNIDTDLYAYSKFDVILYLYQNDFL